MAEEQGLEILQGLTQELQSAELMLGQHAFDAINEHDKLLKSIYDVIHAIHEAEGTRDMINLEMTASIEKSQIEEEQKEALLQLTEQDAMLNKKMLEALMNILTEAEIGSEVIHRMEESVAAAQDAVEAICSFAAGEE